MCVCYVFAYFAFPQSFHSRLGLVMMMMMMMMMIGHLQDDLHLQDELVHPALSRGTCWQMVLN